MEEYTLCSKYLYKTPNIIKLIPTQHTTDAWDQVGSKLMLGKHHSYNDTGFIFRSILGFNSSAKTLAQKSFYCFSYEKWTVKLIFD